MENTIATLFGKVAVDKAYKQGERLGFEWRLGKECDEDQILSLELVASDYGAALRNEWTAMAINSLQEDRIFYCGGYNHFRKHPTVWIEQFTELDRLVTAPHRFFVDLGMYTTSTECDIETDCPYAQNATCKNGYECQDCDEEYTEEMVIAQPYPVIQRAEFLLPWHKLDYMKGFF